MGARLMAIVAEGDRGRVYLAPTPEHEAVALKAKPSGSRRSRLPEDPRNFWTVHYGLTTFGDLFTPRQLVALTTFSDLVQEARERVQRDALAAGLPTTEACVMAAPARRLRGGCGSISGIRSEQSRRSQLVAMRLGEPDGQNASVHSGGKRSRWCGTSRK